MLAWIQTRLLSLFFWILSVFKSVFNDTTTQTISSNDPDEVKFHTKFESQYGEAHPKFCVGSFKQITDESKRKFKPVLVYLHSDHHPDTTVFCKQVLAKQGFQEFVNENYLFYTVDINSKSGYALAQQMQATAFPFLCVFVTIRNQTTVIKRFDGENLDLDTLTGHLIEAHETAHAQLLVLREEEESRNFDRHAREEQDRAYQESLLRDQLREKEKMEKELVQQREITEKMEMEKLKVQQQENSKKLKMDLKSKFTEEPQGKETTLIRFKFPDGSQIQRRFIKTDMVEVLYEYIHHLDETKSSWVPKEKSTMEHYEISAGMPKKNLERKQTLIEAECVPNQTVFVRDTNEDDE